MNLKKFDFANEFGSSESPDDIQSITPRQLNAKVAEEKAKSFKEGHQQGVIDTNADIARVAGDQMFVITGKIEDLILAEENIVNTCHHEVAGLCKLMLEKLSPCLLDLHADKIVEDVLSKALKQIPKNRKITVKVHKKIQPHIETFVRDFVKQTPQTNLEIIVEGNSFEHLTDFNVNFEGGGIERYTKNVIQNMITYLDNLEPTPIETDSTIENQPTKDLEAPNIKEDS